MNWIWTKIKEEKFILLFLVLIAMLRATHEISKFRPQRSWLPEWNYPFGITSPPLDSYHFYGGLFVLIIIAGLRLNLRVSNIIVNRKKDGDYVGIAEAGINTFWQSVLIIFVEYNFFFWMFDWFYHVIFMMPEFVQWEYVTFFLIK